MRLGSFYVISWPRAAVLLAVLVSVGAVAGTLLGRLTRNVEPSRADRAPAAAQAVTVGDLGLRLPEGFRRARGGTALPGLDREGTLLLAGRSRIALAQVPPEHPSLLPAALVRRYQPVPSPGRVRTKQLQAYRYDLPQVGERAAATVLAAPTTRGTVTVACSGHPAAPYECERVLEGLRLVRGRALPAEPDTAFRQRLPAAVERLNGARRPLRQQLATAATRARQARLAGRLASVYGRSARLLAPLAPATGPARDVVGTLGRLDTAHRDLGRAAAALDRSAYRAATDSVRRLEGRLGRQLASLGGPPAA